MVFKMTVSIYGFIVAVATVHIGSCVSRVVYD